MDEVREFCQRVLGAGAAAGEAAGEALSSELPAPAGAAGRTIWAPGGVGPTDRIETLAAACRACRARALGEAAATPAQHGAAELSLGESVALELAAATARLPERQREALALRELLALSYDQISQVMGIEPAAVAPLLARARLALCAERRGSATEHRACAESDRALRALAQRQDSEPLVVDDGEWLPEHLAQCVECDRAHAAMIEASACYRAWPTNDEIPMTR